MQQEVGIIIMAMKSCKQCGYNNWKYKFNDDTREVVATCKQCQYIVKWKVRPRYNPNKIHPFAEYLIENGKVYLRNESRNNFIEVGVKQGVHKNKSYIQVVPVKQANLGKGVILL